MAREERRFELTEQPKGPPTRLIVAGGVVVLVIVAVIVGISVSRNSSTTTKTGAAPTTTAAVTTTRAPVTTAPTTVATTSPASVATTATTTPTTAVTPTTATPTTAVSTPTTAASAATKTAAFCAAAKVYSMNDVLVLADHAVADPNGFEAAYKTMVTNAPTEMVEAIKDIKPITDKGVELVRDGTLKTTAELRDWLANQADKAELEKWVLAQGKLVPQISQLCG